MRDRNKAMGQAGNTRICGNCGTVNSAHDQFCSNCGFALTQAGPADQTILSSTNAPTITASRRVTGALTPGNILGGRYRVVELIGKGGFGAVYKATDGRFQYKRIVAIKEMSDAQLSPKEKAQAIQDFRNEADLLVDLNHPNLPNVSDFFEEGGKAYLVMEFIQGKTLEKVQDETGGPLDETLVMGWALQLCAVLHYLHTRQQPIIFRDMKPSNVMITADGQIKLIDFGIARIFKAAGTKDTTLLGSQGYAPLEQYGRGQSDARSDIYALGATLYDLLTKELPADAPSRRVHPQLFVPPRQINPRIAPEVEAIVLKAMADDPKDRYQTASDMYQAIAATGLAATSGTLFASGATLANMPTLAGSTMQGPTTGPAHPTTPPALNSTVISPPRGGQQAPSTAIPPKRGSQGQVMNPVMPPPATQSGGISRRAVLIGGATLVGVAAVGGTAAILLSSRNQVNKPAGQNGKQPVSPAGTLTLHFLYSTEKQEWMQDVITDFNNSKATVGNQLIQITADSGGSGALKDSILNGDAKPTAYSPASFLELNQLTNAWQQKHGAGQEVVFSSGELGAQSLVQSPLVFAVWRERAKILLQKYNNTIDWQSVHDALQVNNWSSIGGQQAWGPVKFGQTRPDKSNSGLLSITLLAYSYYKISRGLTVEKVNDTTFLKYFNDVQGAVTKFGLSSGTYLEREVIQNGANAYDITATYENLVLMDQQLAQQRQGQPLQPYYPSVNIVSDHPFAILKANTSQPEQAAAKQFRDFLLATPQQKKAVARGFRPTNPNVSTTDASIPNNPFVGKAVQTLGVQIPAQIQNEAQAPNGDVIDALLAQWTKQYSNASTALSISSPEGKGQKHNATPLL